MHSPYTSETFYHMIGWGIIHDDNIAGEEKREHCYRRLKEIINFGFIAGADENNERVRREGIVKFTIDPDGHLRNGDFDGFLVKGCITCYADIPWPSLGLHVNKYGMFGFGVSSDYLVRRGARPVIYIPCSRDDFDTPFRGQGLLRNMTRELVGLHNVVDEFECANNPEGASGYINVEVPHQWSGLNDVLLRDVAAYIKPYDASLDIRHPECYYTEREWRLMGNVEIKSPKVTTIVVAKGYRKRLLQEVSKARDFEVRELDADSMQSRGWLRKISQMWRAPYLRP